jgi:hypothetical protein
MNFHDLRIIVGQIKKSIACPKCKSAYIDEDIDVIGNLSEDQSFFHAACHECESESVINVSVQFPEYEQHQPLAKLGSAPRLGNISVNDVLDMRNFLKSFKGDFKELLS